MDLYCSKCGEPWDHGELESIVDLGNAASIADAAKIFRKYGCGAFDDVPALCDEEVCDPEAAEASSVVMSLGDDSDGWAADLADLL